MSGRSGRSGRNARVAGVISIEGSVVREYLESWRPRQELGPRPLLQLPRLLTSLSALA